MVGFEPHHGQEVVERHLLILLDTVSRRYFQHGFHHSINTLLLQIRVLGQECRVVFDDNGFEEFAVGLDGVDLFDEYFSQEFAGSLQNLIRS